LFFVSNGAAFDFWFTTMKFENDKGIIRIFVFRLIKSNTNPGPTDVKFNSEKVDY